MKTKPATAFLVLFVLFAFFVIAFKQPSFSVSNNAVQGMEARLSIDNLATAFFLIAAIALLGVVLFYFNHVMDREEGKAVQVGGGTK